MSSSETTPHWVLQQKKAFRAWVDSQIAERGLKLPGEVDEAFEDGLYLLPLAEVVSQDKAPKHVKKPRMRIQKIENCSLALGLLVKHGFKPDVAPENFVDKDTVLVMGFIWQLFVTWVGGQGDKSGGKASADDLLKWVQSRVQDNERYPGVPVDNFSTHWQDGKLVSALLDSLSPKILDYESAALDDPVSAWSAALDAAEDWLDVPQVLDADDMVVDKPDDKSVRMQVELIRQAYLALQDDVDSGALFPDDTPVEADAPAVTDAAETAAPPPRRRKRKDPRDDISRDELIDTLLDMYSKINSDCLACPECATDLTQWAADHNARVPELPAPQQ
ncbi:uncharacterized protein AMSG_07274 [Thecamonas trahens ATCC 50062]|uniref:Calponin-homology (CH) domain-containing protein n=1 Tax=Thecamonas trahens ATCC 50062 TaxID=461836 RepID=A0A0L0DGM4_THETB|nr:hypothetical protein AMSG_07274 [Thecamonas trahens ATCC 50062]KNC51271.1 hypothetical protein AMSG_07274 [Thecamonas trahens ATCC 50062]|eukprot:XP_013756199.1 hypothetical protein AMSG_07274 [Thecamonas trahens ATCC 50062]